MTIEAHGMTSEALGITHEALKNDTQELLRSALNTDKLLRRAQEPRMHAGNSVDES